VLPKVSPVSLTDRDRGSMAHLHCPHCARPLTTVGATSRDHVVPEAMGGLEKVRTCKVCNDVLGGGVESRLLSPTGWLTLLAQSQGWTKGDLAGENEHGHAVQAHVGNQTYRLLKPREQVLDEDEDHVQLGVVLPVHIGGEYLEHLAATYGGTLSVVSQETAPPEWARFDISCKIDDLRRLVAKVALCTGTRRWSDDFVLSPLAQWLREVQDVWQDWPPDLKPGPVTGEHVGGRWPMSPEEVSALTEQLQSVLPPILSRMTQGLPVVGHVKTPPPMTFLIPVESGRQTVVAVAVLGVLLPLLLAPHPLPNGVARPVVVVHPQRARRGSSGEHAAGS
jgi:hypothetical protein